MKSPKTSGEWQDAVDAAHVLLLVDSARQYGLITGGPKVNVERAVQLLRHGKQRGIHPRPDAIDRLIGELS